MTEHNLTIPSKKGPFRLRKLGLSAVLEVMGSYDGMTQEEKILSLVQNSLIDSAGKQVYSKKQYAKMEEDLGGIKLLQLSMEVQNINNFDDFQNFGDKVEAAEKN